MSGRDDDREARLADAMSAARARDRTADETGRRRDNLLAVLAIWRVAWRLRRVHHDDDQGGTE